MKKTPNRIVIINALSAGLLNGISMIMMPVYSYLLGAEVYGLASIYTTWVTILSVIIGLQIHASLGVAQKDFPANEQLAYQANGIYIGFAICIIVTGLIAVFARQLSVILEIPLWLVLLLGPHAFGIFCVGMLNDKFTYEFKQEKNLIVSVSMSLGTALISVIAIVSLPKESRLYGKVIGVAVPYILCAAILLLYILRRVGLCIKKVYIRYMLQYSAPLVFSNLCLQFFTGSDKLMLQKMESNSEVGIYSLVFNFSAVISSIWFALNHAWTPFYYQYEAADDRKTLLEHTKKYNRLFSVLTIGFILLSPEVFPLFSAPEFHVGAKMIPVFVVGFYLDYLGCYARNYQYYYKHTKIIAGISIVVSICNVVLNAVFIPKWGAMGAAAATMMAQLLSCGMHWVSAIRHSVPGKKYPYSLRLFASYLILLMASVIMFYLSDTWIIRWSAGVILGIWLFSKLILEKQLF